MLPPKRQLLVAAMGLSFAVAGVFLRLNAKALSMQTSAPTPVIAPGGKSLGGSIRFSVENTARTGALTDIGMVLVYAGVALLVLAVGTWMFTGGENGKSMPRIRSRMSWRFWKRGPEPAGASASAVPAEAMESAQAHQP
jgi:hypothetical protein